MACFTIAGCYGCCAYTRVEEFADYLHSALGVRFHKIVLEKCEWKDWIRKICGRTGWKHTESPIIWKELPKAGGRKFLIGGINEFFNYCSGYYGRVSGVDPVSMQIATKDAIKEHLLQKALAAKKRPRVVCIIHAANMATYLLIPELAKIKGFPTEVGVKFYLLDELHRTPLFYDLKDETQDLGMDVKVSVRSEISHWLGKCDLAIFLNNIQRDEEESLGDWLRRNKAAMKHYGTLFRKYASPDCRVILASSEAAHCYNGNVFAHVARNLDRRNIVVITGDELLKMKRVLAEKTKVCLTDMSCLSIWGFVGVNHLIDLNSVLVKNPTGCIVPPAGIDCHRPMKEFLLNDKKRATIYIEAAERKKHITKILGRYPTMAKVTAIISTIRHWYGGSRGVVLCMGVSSNGTFGFPENLFFSQPVCLTATGFWRPCRLIDIPRDPYCGLNPLIDFALDVMKKHGVREKYEIVPPHGKPRYERDGYSMRRFISGMGKVKKVTKIMASEASNVPLEDDSDELTPEGDQEEQGAQEVGHSKTSLECVYSCKSDPWQVEEQEYQFSEEQEYQFSEEQEYQLSGEQEYQLSGEQEYQLSGEQEYQLSGEQEYQLPVEQEYLLSEDQGHHLPEEQENLDP